jgi:hypothetical protein
MEAKASATAHTGDIHKVINRAIRLARDGPLGFVRWRGHVASRRTRPGAEQSGSRRRPDARGVTALSSRDLSRVRASKGLLTIWRCPPWVKEWRPRRNSVGPVPARSACLKRSALPSRLRAGRSASTLTESGHRTSTFRQALVSSVSGRPSRCLSGCRTNWPRNPKMGPSNHGVLNQRRWQGFGLQRFTAGAYSTQYSR